MKSSFEGENVKYYELFFLPDKKIQSDIDYLMGIIRANKASKHALLDVGCGTGAHAHSFGSFFEEVYAIDISRDMVEHARMNHYACNVNYECLDIVQHAIKFEKIDIAVSLAHVIGYQLKNESVKAFVEHVGQSLKKGGLFIFTFYNMAAVYLGQLEPRTVTVDKGGIQLTRLSNATIDAENNCLLLDYYYIVEDKGKLKTYEVHEKMRCFTKMEMDYYLKENGFMPICYYAYGTNHELTSHEWNGLCVARKV